MSYLYTASRAVGRNGHRPNAHLASDRFHSSIVAVRHAQQGNKGDALPLTSAHTRTLTHSTFKASLLRWGPITVSMNHDDAAVYTLVTIILRRASIGAERVADL